MGQKIAAGFTIAFAATLVVGFLGWPCFLKKKAARCPECPSALAPGYGPAFGRVDGLQAQKAGPLPPPGATPGMPGAPEAEPRRGLDANAYVTSTYLGGRGERERLAKLIQDGVSVAGKHVKLAAFSQQYSQAFPIPTQAALIRSGQAGEAAKAIDEQMVVVGVAAQEWKDPDLDKDGALLAAY